MKRVALCLLALTALSSSWVSATGISPHCNPHREVIHADDNVVSLARHAGVDRTHFYAWLDEAPAATRKAMHRMRPGDIFELCLRPGQGGLSVASLRIRRDIAGRRLAEKEASQAVAAQLVFAGVTSTVTTTATPLAAAHTENVVQGVVPGENLLIIKVPPGRSLGRALERRLGRRPLITAVADFVRHRWHLPAHLPKGSRCSMAVLASETAGHGRRLRLAYVDVDYHGHRRRAYPYVDHDGRDFIVGSHGRSFRVLTPLLPLRRSRISSGWGWRIQPVLGGNEFHHGIDYAAPPGTPIRATMAGRVDMSGWHGNYGRMVEIRHAHGFTTRYGHLRAFARAARVGSHVHRGQIIGYVGTSGLSTGPHLYYEVWKHGRRINPLKHRHLLFSERLSASERRQFSAFVARMASRETLSSSGPAPQAGAS